MWCEYLEVNDEQYGKEVDKLDKLLENVPQEYWIQ